MSGSFLSESPSVREESPMIIGCEEEEGDFVYTQQVDRPLAGTWRLGGLQNRWRGGELKVVLVTRFLSLSPQV